MLMPKKTIFFVILLAIVVALFAFRGNRVANPEIPMATPSEIVSLKNGTTYDLVAQFVTKEIDGKKINMLAYNGSIPGPTIRVSEGDTIVIRFTNKTDVPTLLHSLGQTAIPLKRVARCRRFCVLPRRKRWEFAKDLWNRAGCGGSPLAAGWS